MTVVQNDEGVKKGKLSQSKWLLLGVAIPFLLLFIWINNSYVSLPFSSDALPAWSLEEYQEKFRELGFTDVSVEETILDFGEASEAGIDIEIESVYYFDENTSFSKSKPVTINYTGFSEDSVLYDGGSKPLLPTTDEMVDWLKDLGFTDVMSIATYDSSVSKSVFDRVEILSDDFEKTPKEDYYYPKDTMIRVFYKEPGIKISNFQLLKNPDEMVAWLKAAGFTNVEKVEEEWGNTPGEVNAVTLAKDLQFANGDKLEDGVYAKTTEIKVYYRKVEDRNPANYQTVSYDAWNHNEVASGTKVQITGEVIQVSKGFGQVTLRVATGNSEYLGYIDDVVLVTLSTTLYHQTVLAEEDLVTIYGESTGRTTYETVLGANMTLPSMKATFYNRQ